MDIVLFVSTMGDFCHGVDSVDQLEYAIRSSESLAETTPLLAEEYRVWAKSQQYTLYELCDLVSRFRTRKECLVIRPHPSDNVNFIKYLFANLENVKVCDDYSIIPWLFSSKAVVCSTSTVAMEAQALGIKPICLLPDIGPDGDFLKDIKVNRIGSLARNAAEVEKMLDITSPVYSNINNEENKQKIVSHFVETLESVSLVSHRNHRLMRFLTSVLSVLFRFKRLLRPRHERYFSQKFPGFKTIYPTETLRGFSWYCDRAVVFDASDSPKNKKTLNTPSSLKSNPAI